jgi:hypothetical protein
MKGWPWAPQLLLNCLFIDYGTYWRNSLFLQYYVRGQFRYVDDLLVLIILNESSTNISELLHEFKNIFPKLNVSVEPEDSNKINFLDDHLHERSRFHVDFLISKTNYNRLHDSPLLFPFIWTRRGGHQNLIQHYKYVYKYMYKMQA